ncbi:MAG: dimethyl sulfoxide reductase anchor subunit [Acidobacteria bacterium]|nr:dimethyl sulfoxide reductase anchor subunit [Acidobacteriota bacterium]
MQTNEWPLVLFTLLCQTAVGVFLVSELLTAAAVRRMEMAEVLPLSAFLRLSILLITLAAAGISFFHLGRPLNAFRTLGNLSTSWLSREILFLLIFAACTVLLLGMASLAPQALAVARLFQVTGGLAGLLLIFTMSRIYMLPAVPTWNSMFTPRLFFSSTLLLGTAVTAALWAVRLHAVNPELSSGITAIWYRKTSPLLAGLTAGFLLISILLTVLFALRMQKFQSLLQASERLFPSPGIVLLFRILLLLTAVVLAAVLFLHVRSETDSLSPLLAPWLILLGLIITAEVLGRHLFYNVFTRTGGL